MVNTCIFIGRLTRDPELKYTPNGVAVTRFTLAVDRPFTNANGDREADFIDVVAWRKLAETCAQHLGKGRLVFVEGPLQIRSYDDSNGIRRKAAEIIANNVRFLDRKKEAQGNGGIEPPPLDDSFAPPGPADNMDEEIPF